MTGHGGRLPAATSVSSSIKEIRRGVAGAADAQLLKVLRMVESLEVRGATDELLVPVRPRLREIRPERPLRFARLLFLPADPLIVSPAAWRPGVPFLPRTAVMVLSNAVHEVMLLAVPDCLARIEDLIANANTGQTALVRQAGALLWARAALILREAAAKPPARLPASWSAQGLPAAELPHLAAAMSAILHSAVALHDHAHAGRRLQESDLAEMLARSEELGERAWAMMLGLLTIKVPEASATLFTAAQKVPARRKQAEEAAELALTWLEQESGAQMESLPPRAAVDLRNQANLLDTLTDQLSDPALRRRLGFARTALVDGSLQRYELELQSHFAAPLLALPDAGPARDAALDNLEDALRVLRAFELEARRIGGGPKFDGFVQGAQASLRDVAGLSGMDRARLTEILAGAEAALRVLEQERPVAPVRT